MSVKKIISASILPFFLSSLLFSQSLVDLAKKERERRERLKGEKKIIVTNADLRELKKRPAVSIPQPVVGEEENQGTVTSEKKSPPKKTRALEVPEADKIELKKTISDFEEKWIKAKEYADLLTLKMNALWQEFYSLDDMISRDSIQREISETYLKLQKAKIEEEKAKKELDNSRQQLKK